MIITLDGSFLFDVDLGPLPHPPLLPRGCKLRFRPVTSALGPLRSGVYTPLPPGGVFEADVSKLIRNLVLTCRFTREVCLSRLHAIPVPTAGRRSRVRFNPERHTVYIRKITTTRSVNALWHRPATGADDDDDDAEPWSGLDFNIGRLYYMWPGPVSPSILAAFKFIFPKTEHSMFRHSNSILENRPTSFSL